MKNSRLFRYSILVMVIAVSISWQAVGSLAWAQSKPKTAAIAFQMQPTQLLASEAGQMLPLDQIGGGTDNGFAKVMMNAKAVRGVVTLSESIEDFMFFQGGELPADIYVEMEFADSADAKAAVADFEKELTEQSEIRKVGNYRYFSPKNNEANVQMVFDIPNKLVFMTDTYEYDSKNLENISDAAKAAFTKAANVPFSLLLDFDTARPMIKQGIEMARKDAPPPVLPFLEIPGQISLLQLTGNPGKEPVMSLIATSPNEDNADLLQETLQGLIGMGKMAARAADPNDPTTAILNQVLGQLKPVREGKVITLTLSKIEGLENLLGQ